MDLAANISDTHIPSGANISSNLSSAQIDAIGGTMEALDEFGAMDDCLFRPTMENYGMIFAFCVIFCLSVIGNSIVVVVILQQSSMRSVTNLYLLNLALSDLLLSVVCMPPTLVSSLVYCWVFGDLLCKLLAYLQPVVVTASAYTLAAIALERYYAICKPLHSRIWHTRTHAMFVISLVWLVSVIANVFMLFMYEERTYNRNGLNCAPKFEPIVHFGYQIYMTVVLLLVPLVAMTVLYGNVISTLNAGIRMDIAAVEIENNNNENGAVVGCSMKKKCSPNVSVMFTADLPTEPKKTRLWHPFIKSEAREAPQHKNSMAWRNASLTAAEQSLRSTHSGKTAIAKQRLIRMLIVIVVVFFCCWTPSYIWWLLLNAQDAFGTFNIWNSELNTFITILTYLSSCTNPITYCFLNNKFRNALFLTFGCRSPVRGSTRGRFMRGAHNIQHRQRHAPRTENDSDGSNPNNTSESGAKRKDKKTANCCMDLLVRTKWTLPSLARRISSRKYRIEEGNEMRALNNIE